MTIGLSFAPDPVTGGLVRDSAGFFVLEESATDAVHCQLTHELDAWPADPPAGSRLSRALELGDGPDGVEFVTVELARALGILADDGLIGQVVASAERSDVGRIFGQTSYRDLVSGQRVDLAVDPFDGGR